MRRILLVGLCAAVVGTCPVVSSSAWADETTPSATTLPTAQALAPLAAPVVTADEVDDHLVATVANQADVPVKGEVALAEAHRGEITSVPVSIAAKDSATVDLGVDESGDYTITATVAGAGTMTAVGKATWLVNIDPVVPADASTQTPTDASTAPASEQTEGAPAVTDEADQPAQPGLASTGDAA